jgi:hypothetical protein
MRSRGRAMFGAKRERALEDNLSRGRAGAGLASPGLPWAGTSVEDRIDKLEKEARAAKKLYDGQQEDQYRCAAAEVYANLRASWERGLDYIALARAFCGTGIILTPKI